MTDTFLSLLTQLHRILMEEYGLLQQVNPDLSTLHTEKHTLITAIEQMMPAFSQDDLDRIKHHADMVYLMQSIHQQNHINTLITQERVKLINLKIELLQDQFSSSYNAQGKKDHLTSGALFNLKA